MFLDFAQQRSFCILKNILYPKKSFLYPKNKHHLRGTLYPKKSILYTPKKWHPNCCTMSNATSGCLCLIMDKQSAQLAQKPADWCGMRPGDQSRPKTMAMTLLPVLSQGGCDRNTSTNLCSEPTPTACPSTEEFATRAHHDPPTFCPNVLAQNPHCPNRSPAL